MKYLLLLPIILCIFNGVFMACSEKNGTNNDTHLSEGLVDFPYPIFNNFPEQQFKSVMLGQTYAEVENELSKMSITTVAKEEDHYFYFPSDSTELIIPSSPRLTEFKIFLKSALYLENPSKFQEFLSNAATKELNSEIFTVFFYETNHVDFKLTLFKQPKSIRLHFIMTKSHA